MEGEKKVMFCWEGVLPAPQVRTIGDMRSVLRDPDCRYDAPLYFMYRDLARNEADYAWLRKNSLRYDITEIPPANLCGEPVKTKGIIIRGILPGRVSEVYEVLAGTAHYLLHPGITVTLS
jgi:glucose-6-phosphate isomerase